MSDNNGVTALSPRGVLAPACLSWLGPHRKLFWACISLHVNKDDVFGIFVRNMAEEAQ